jgi:hypothetical protein
MKLDALYPDIRPSYSRDCYSDACNKTNLMHCLSSVYLVTVPLYVSDLLVVHHQEVIIQYMQQMVRVARSKTYNTYHLLHIHCCIATS